MTLHLSRAGAAALALSTFLFAGCAVEAPRPGGAPRGLVCIDVDGDGLGDGCSAGIDCDDDDPTVGNECYSPTPEGPCETGALRSCKVMLNDHDGVVSCFEGTQACVEGAWGACTAGPS